MDFRYFNFDRGTVLELLYSDLALTLNEQREVVRCERNTRNVLGGRCLIRRNRVYR